MIRHVQPLLNRLLRSKHYYNTYLMRSGQCRRLTSLRCSLIHHHTSCNIAVREVPLVSSLLPYLMVRNKWSKSSLIQQSPTSYVYCYGVVRRYYSTDRTHQSGRNRSTLVYTTAVAIVVLGLSYAAVPLYRMFCQVMFISPCTTSNRSPYRIQCNSSSNRSPYRIQCNSSSNRSPYRIQCNSSSNRSPYRIQCNSSSNRSPYRIQCNSSSNRSPYRIQCNSSSSGSSYYSGSSNRS